MKVQTIRLIFNELNIPPRCAPRIRGYLASRYPQYLALHNHDGDKYVYSYPLIQYKVIKSTPFILGISEASAILKQVFSEIEVLNISREQLQIYERTIEIAHGEWTETDEIYDYEFLTPWMALNQSNHTKYLNSNLSRQSDLLNRIFTGNILSISKCLNYTVQGRIRAYTNVRPIEVNFKDKPMLAFKGKVSVNFLIPDYWGLGKSTSRGFGTIKRLK